MVTRPPNFLFPQPLGNNVIISQTPYRVSFAGGGTDLPAFYEREPGAVLSLTLKHHIYVTVSPAFEDVIRVAYSKTITAKTVDEVRHTIIREALRMTELGTHIEITTIGDVPAGTGMGSSSSLAVGVMNALYALKGQIASPKLLAEKACEIELDILRKPIGRQDQYAAAHGGLNYIRFNSDHSVHVEPVPHDPQFLYELQQRALLIFTQSSRRADDILRKQTRGTMDRFAFLRDMRDLADEMRQCVSKGDLNEFEKLLHRGWELKRSLGFGITTTKVDGWYEVARKAGATGGKLLGAGGGGFLLLLAPPKRHNAIREALGHPRELPFIVDPRGSRIIFISDRYTI